LNTWKSLWWRQSLRDGSVISRKGTSWFWTQVSGRTQVCSTREFFPLNLVRQSLLKGLEPKLQMHRSLLWLEVYIVACRNQIRLVFHTDSCIRTLYNTLPYSIEILVQNVLDIMYQQNFFTMHFSAIRLVAKHFVAIHFVAIHLFVIHFVEIHFVPESQYCTPFKTVWEQESVYRLQNIHCKKRRFK